MRAKDITKLVRKLRHMGADVTLTRRNHYKVKCPSGALVVLPGTPTDTNAGRAIRAQLKRAGMEV